MEQTITSTRPMNVIVDRNSRAATIYRDWAAVIAPGIAPTPDHDLIYRGGKIIPNLTFTNFYVGGEQAWQPSDMQSIDAALAAAMSDRDLNNVMVQYFKSGSITSTSKPSTVLPGSPPSTVNQTDIESVVASLNSNGQLTGADLTSTVFNFMLPQGTVLSDQSGSVHKGAPHHRKKHGAELPKDEADSLHGLGGYHGSIHASNPSGGQVTIYYAVGVYSERRPDGTVNGIPVFDAPWKNVVATFYHELNEARTDADVEDAVKAGNGASLVGWVSKEGEECGDFPVFEANPLTQVFKEVPLTSGHGTVPIQFMYSNAVHGPEGPIPNPH
jgi:hypothetical protein